MTDSVRNAIKKLFRDGGKTDEDALAYIGALDIVQGGITESRAITRDAEILETVEVVEESVAEVATPEAVSDQDVEIDSSELASAIVATDEFTNVVSQIVQAAFDRLEGRVRSLEEAQVLARAAEAIDKADAPEESRTLKIARPRTRTEPDQSQMSSSSIRSRVLEGIKEVAR